MGRRERRGHGIPGWRIVANTLGIGGTTRSTEPSIPRLGGWSRWRRWELVRGVAAGALVILALAAGVYGLAWLFRHLVF